jgi:hypothetical protein
MTALIHMTDDDLKALGIPMVSLNETKILHSFIFLSFLFWSLSIS